MYYVMDENYNLSLYIDNNGVIWKRFGKCTECGVCCVALHPENFSKGGMCKYLNIHNKCSITKHKPIHCRMSPVNPEVHKHIITCGYRWKKITVWDILKEVIKNEI